MTVTNDFEQTKNVQLANTRGKCLSLCQATY